MSEKAPFMVFSGTNSRYLAEKICASLDCPLGKMNIVICVDEFQNIAEFTDPDYFKEVAFPLAAAPECGLLSLW